MKINLPSILDCGARIMTLCLIIYFSIKVDKFTFGMMNVKNSISFGLGVSLFIGINILASFLFYKLSKSTFNKHFKKIK